MPTQLFIFIPVIALFWWWLHRTAFGRSYYAIGFSQEGSRYAGIKVRRRLNFMYCLSGLLASLAAVIYVAHLGQAKSDAGTGYELTAIAAVVLGGASIFGGRGTVLGTILGLLAIVILQNGLRLSGQPTELAGILTGVLLVLTILIDRVSRIGVSRTTVSEEEFEVKNWQIGVLSGVILVAAIIVAASNWMLVRSIKDQGGTNPAAQSQNTADDGQEERHRDDAKGQGRSIFHQLPKRRGRSGERTWRRTAVGRPDRSRPGKAK